VSQSTYTDPDQSLESDPLLEFLAEPVPGAVLGPSVRPANAAEPVVNVADPGAATSGRAERDEDAELRRRVERAERLLEKSVVEISTLKSDLATLVSSLDDIRKRQSRRADPAPAPRPRKLRKSVSNAVAAAVVVVAIGLALLGGLSIAAYDAAAPMRMRTGSAAPVAVPAPAVIGATPAAQIQKPAPSKAALDR
jgi:hypothetical protein